MPATKRAKNSAASTAAPIDHWIAGALILFAVLFVFSQVSTFSVVDYDDTTFTTDNFLITPGLTWNGIQYAFRSLEMGSWHPLTWISHMIDFQLFGEDIGWHHLVNVAIHLANSMGLFLLAWWLSGAVWPAAAVALLFAIHPMHVEPVAWLADRKGLLSTLFWLASLGAWVRWIRDRDKRFYAVSIAAFALGLMTKPTIVTLPFTLLLFEFWPLRRWTAWRELPSRLLDKVPFFLLTAALSVATYYGQKEAGAMESLGHLTLGQRLTNAAYGFGMYLGKTFWPADLAINYTVSENPSMVVVALSALVLTAVSALAFLKSHEYPWLFAGWFWFVGTMVPSIGIIQTGDQAFADRYSYVPHIGLFALLIAAAAHLAPREIWRRTAMRTVLVILFAVMAWRSHGQTSYWANGPTLFEHTARVVPNHISARQILARHHIRAGRLPEARARIEEAIKLDPSDPENLRTLAEVEFQEGRKDKALETLAAAERAAPNSALTQFNRGIVLRDMERYEEAITAYRRAIDLGLLPDNRMAAWFAIGICYNRLHNEQEAIPAFRKVLEVDPYHYLGRKNLAYAHFRLQQYVEAQREFELLNSMNENDPDVKRPLTFLRNRK